MNRSRYQPWCHMLLSALLVVLVVTANSWSQKAPPGIQPNPQAPTLNMPVPLGIQRGTTLELNLTGTNLAEPTGLWTSFPARVTIPTDNNNGKDNTKLRVQLEVPRDAPLGFHSIRLATTRGMSNFRVFCLDELPPVLEVENNRSKATAQSVPIPCVVVGRADPEVSDYFKIHAQAGQRVTFEILGRRLGSALDPQLSLYDPRTSRELPGGHSNDAPGLQTDPRLTYTFKEMGDYLIEVRDVMYRGGADHWYRLRIGDFPCATAPVPMAARRGSQRTIHFAGPVVEGVAPVEVYVPADPNLNSVWLTPRGANGLHGWPVALAVSDLEESVEQEPNNEASKANRIPVPGGITGRFQESGDVDVFVFAAKKGQRLTIEAHTHELYSPTEVYLVLKDAKEAQLAASNPAQAARLEFTAPADGDYYVVLEHLLYWSGPSEVYRLTVTPREPGFELSLGIDRHDISQGGLAALSLFATRRDYTGPIEVSVVSPPGITGQVTIKPGQPPAPAPAQANAPPQPAAQLFLSAVPDLPMEPYDLVIQGRAIINGKMVVATTSVRTSVIQSMAGLTYPPRQFHGQVGLAVTEKAPFELRAQFDQPEGTRGSPVPLTITARRATGFAEEIVLAPLNLPANVTAALKNIPKGQNEVKVQLTPAANATLGEFPISFLGKAKSKNRDFTATAVPVALVLALPFELKVEPATLKLAPGEKGKVRVTATRKAGYQGPIELELKNLPAHVAAPKATLDLGQTSVEIEVVAAAEAATVSKADVNVQGTAKAAANQQVVSPRFAVNVQGPPAFELQVEPTPLQLTPGSKTKIKVTANRKGYDGPITVELRNLPALVTAPKTTIEMGQTAVEIEVTAADNAAVGEKADIHVLGLATAAANQQQVSPNFTVNVGKK